MIHELKIWPQFFQPVVDGLKTWELRKADRPYQVGDQLLLVEWDPLTESYSGRSQTVMVRYLSRIDPLIGGHAFVCMTIERVFDDR